MEKVIILKTLQKNLELRVNSACTHEKGLSYERKIEATTIWRDKESRSFKRKEMTIQILVDTKL